MTISLRYAARSDTGLVREGNEDSVYAGPRLLAVADGMGGHAAGEVASAVVIAGVSVLDDDVPGTDLLGALKKAVLQANRSIAEMVAGDEDLRGMGTTLTAILSEGNRLGLVHVGDSRAYLLRDGELRQITSDHTLVQALVDEGRITPEEADVHPQRSFITRTLDGSPVELDLSVREARVGDRFLLCSDGLSGVVSDPTLAEALGAEPDPARCADRLIELALRGGGPDNVTCIVADVVDVPGDGATAPVLAGAVAPGQDEGDQLPDTAAGRAAAVRPRRTHRRTPAEAAPATAGHRRPRRALVVGLATLLLTALGIGGAGYVQAQYYVGNDRGTVAVFRGVSGSVLGISLHRVKHRSEVPVAALPAYEESRVRQGVSAAGVTDAERILENLTKAWEQHCLIPDPAASPSLVPATPTPRPTVLAPTPKPRVSGSPPAVTPRPTPTATPPADCAE
ncbi:MAG: family protein phosphatase [Frankiales bacterium]|nr:family protein phosphatase [Frankiales bacterium]